MFGAKTGQKIVLIQYKKDFVPLILSDLVHRASHITLEKCCKIRREILSSDLASYLARVWKIRILRSLKIISY